MENWKWDVVQIHSLAAEFETIASLLSQLSNNLDSYGDDIGASNVAGAFHAIANNWSLERDKLVSEFKTASSSLSVVAKSYEDVENKISQSN